MSNQTDGAYQIFYSIPGPIFIGLKTAIEALTGVQEGAFAVGYTTTPADGVFGFYDGSAWVWGSGGGGVESVTGDGVDNTDPANPIISYPTPGDIGAEPALGYTPENVANKKTTMTGNEASDTFYLTAKAIYDWATGLFLQKNSPITPGTNTKITYGANGLVTAGTVLSATDIPDLDAAKITSGTFDPARLPLPTTTAIGAVKRNTGSLGQFVSGIDTDGSLLYAVPSSGAGGAWIYGNGADGEIDFDGTNTYPFASLSGTTYTLNRNLVANNLTVQSGITLKPNQYVIFVLDTLDNQGTIQSNGNNASGASIPTAQAAGFFGAHNPGAAGIASGAAAANGVSAIITAGTLFGGIGGRGAAGWASALTFEGLSTIVSSMWASASFGGWFSTRVNLFALLSRVVTPAGGMGGGSGAKSAVGTALSSGAGGNGGGIIMLIARTIINSGTISANGGNGGDAAGTGGNSGGGGGGGGGTVLLTYDSLTDTGTIQANGGNGGASVAGGTTPLKAEAVQIGSSNVLTSNRITFAPTSTNGAQKNTLYMLAVDQQGSSLADPTSVTGWGLTWTKIAHVDYASSGRRVNLYYAYGTPGLTPDNITIRVVFSSGTASAASIHVDEIQNATGTIVQSNTNSTASATTLTVTLANPFGSTNAAAYGVFGFAGGTARVAGTGFTKVTDYTSAPLAESQLGYNDTTVDVSWTTAAAAAGIAVEIQAVSSMESGIAGQNGQIIYLPNL